MHNPYTLRGEIRKRAALAREARTLGLGLMSCILLLFVAASSAAQGLGASEIPSMRYYASIDGEYFDGEFERALETFNDERRGAIKKPGMLWLDSICYYSMMGECYYHMGQLEKALDCYTTAIQLYVQHNDWLILVDFQNPRPANLRPCPWGTSSRGAKMGDFPRSMSIMQGEINVTAQIERGGLVQQAIKIPIHVSEIIRCTCLAIRRRTELLGPLSPEDPLTKDLVDVLSRRPGPPNHWSQAWIDVQLGLALIAAGKPTEAIPALNRAIVASGQYDHPLTPTVLVELGRLALDRGDYKTAIGYLNEAGISAYFYDANIIEESLLLGTVAHLASNTAGLYAPIPAVAVWAKTKGYRHLQASLLLNAAECSLADRQSRDAAKSLGDAKLLATRRGMGLGMIGARYGYLLATLHFQEGRLLDGYQELTQAMTFMQLGSRWLFQLGRLDRHALAGNISINSSLTPRAAMDMYEFLLRDPTSLDWALRPMEALAYLKTPHPQSYEHWFLIAVSRKDQDRALEIADLSRRHRFHSSLQFGGRLLSLRTILEAPDQELPRELLLERQNLRTEYATYEAMSQQAAQIRRELKAIPLTAPDQDTSFKQRKLFEQWQQASDKQEALLREIAVRRDAASLVFPPVRPLKQIREALPEGHAILAFYRAKGEIYGFLLNRDDYALWRLPSAKLSRSLVTALRDMGQYDGNRQFTVEELADQKWKESSRTLLRTILEGSRADLATEFPELVIIPDDVLWYVPFETLQVEVNGQLRPLIDRFRIRYMPTVSLAMQSGAPSGDSPGTQTHVALGRLFMRDDGSLSRTAFERIAQAVPRTIEFPSSPLPAPTSLLAPLVTNLIVLDDIRPAQGDPYAWSPLQAERGRPGNTLADWLSLPLGGPAVVMLPGYHTPAEDTLKSAPAAAPGQDMFLAVCGLMATGTRTILLSRWRCGGQTSVGFVQEFAQELPHTTPADAYQRAVLVTAGSRLELDREPRVREARQAAPMANHPFFWGGFMLIDPGAPDPAPAVPEALLPHLDLLR
jgi:CHAT domain-containing protein/tetratricopeptide (TPR) repeat protein